MDNAARADSLSRSGVQAGSQTTLTSTVSTPVQRAAAPPGSRSTCSPRTGTSPWSGSGRPRRGRRRVERLRPPPCPRSTRRGRRSRGRRRRAGRLTGARGPSTLLLRSKTIRKPVVRCGALRVGGEHARADEPVGGVEVGAALDDVLVAPPTPRRCRRGPGAPGPWSKARTGVVQPQPASTQLQRSGSNVSPHGHVVAPAPRPPTRRRVGSRPPSRAQKAAASARVTLTTG